MDPLIEALLGEMPSESGPGQTLIWRTALGRMISLGFELPQIRLLLEAVDGPRQLSGLAGLVGRSAGGAQMLLDAGERSEAGLVPLVRGLLVLLAYLDAEGRSTQLELALGYLACCDEAPGLGGPGGSLADRVRAHLEDHGFDG